MSVIAKINPRVGLADDLDHSLFFIIRDRGDVHAKLVAYVLSVSPATLDILEDETRFGIFVFLANEWESDLMAISDATDGMELSLLHYGAI